MGDPDNPNELWKLVHGRDHKGLRSLLKDDMARPPEDRQVNCPDSQGNTPIFQCATDGELMLVQELHRAGAFLNHRNANNECAVHCALAMNRFSCVEYLIKQKNTQMNGIWQDISNKMQTNGCPLQHIRLMQDMLKKYYDWEYVVEIEDETTEWPKIVKGSVHKTKPPPPSCAWATPSQEPGIADILGSETKGLDEEEEPDIFDLWVKLISKEGHSFIVDKECCMASGTIRTMLTGPGVWRETFGGKMPTINFEEISTPVLEKTIQYFHYKKKYDHSAPPLPAFPIEPEHTVDVLLAAHFLDT